MRRGAPHEPMNCGRMGEHGERKGGAMLQEVAGSCRPSGWRRVTDKPVVSDDARVSRGLVELVEARCEAQRGSISQLQKAGA